MPAAPPATKEGLVSVLARYFATRPEVDLAILFGSRARDVPRPRSDVDVAVAGRVDRLAVMRDLSFVTGLDADVVPLEGAGHPLLLALLRDGIVVHEGSPHAAARWRTGAILLTETDGPAFARMRDAFLRRLAGASRG